MRAHFWRFGIGLLLAGSVSAQTIFTEATEEIGIRLAGRSARNIVFVDYDNDGLQDIFLGENTYFDRQIALFHNTGGGRSVDQTALIPNDLHQADGGSGAIFADYDNDGDQDLFLPVFPHNLLLRNDRETFSKVALVTGEPDTLGTDNAIWLDYDRDGYLDLYVGNERAENDQPRSNRLFRNDGNGSFSDRTAEAGLDALVLPEASGVGGGMAAADFNDDGWPDLYVGVFEGANRLFLNNGQGGFRDATTSEILDEGEAYSIAVGDIDNDGDLDLFQGAGGSGEAQFRSKMLLNIGDGQFLDVLENVGLDTLARGNVGGTTFADFDNDGDLDLLVGISNQIHHLFLNDGSGFFSEVTGQSGLDDRSPQVAVGDYDEDGFLDLLYALSQTRSITAFFRNNGNENHWLRVKFGGYREQSRRHRGAVDRHLWRFDAGT